MCQIDVEWGLGVGDVMGEQAGRFFVGSGEWIRCTLFPGMNLCGRPYVEDQCMGCRFKYYRDAKTAMCIPCGFTQVLASLLMSGAGVMACVGGFLGMMLLLKFKSDLKFKVVLKLVFKTRIARPVAGEIAHHKDKINRCIVCFCPKAFYVKHLPRKTVYIGFEELGSNRSMQLFRDRWTKELFKVFEQNAYVLKREYLDDLVKCVGTKKALQGGGIPGKGQMGETGAKSPTHSKPIRMGHDDDHSYPTRRTHFIFKDADVKIQTLDYYKVWFNVLYKMCGAGGVQMTALAHTWYGVGMCGTFRTCLKTHLPLSRHSVLDVLSGGSDGRVLLDVRPGSARPLRVRRECGGAHRGVGLGVGPWFLRVFVRNL